MKIKVTIKNNYGVETVYPDCDNAKNFASIARQKTLTLQTLELIKKLGYSIEVNQQADNNLIRSINAINEGK